MLRIDLTSPTEREALVTLSGDFTGEYIPCVEHALSAARAKEALISLNLKHVLLVDRGAMCYLSGLREAGVELNDCPAYVVRWMEQERENCG